MLPLDVSFDLIDEVSLPPDMLPSKTDPFIPAGSFADFRPDGLQFAAAVEVTLSFHTPESGSRRIFVFSYNHSWLAWQRHTDFGCVVDVASSTVTTKLAHFSLSGVMLEEMGFKTN